MFTRLLNLIRPFELTVNRFGYLEPMIAHRDGTLTGTTVWCKKPVITTHRFFTKHQLQIFVAAEMVEDLLCNTGKAYSGTWYMQ
ncbi:MAG: hypothetical protein ACI9H6_000362 [Patiriisocius sp.]|jgi:hypothetical protein